MNPPTRVQINIPKSARQRAHELGWAVGHEQVAFNPATLPNLPSLAAALNSAHRVGLHRLLPQTDNASQLAAYREQMAGRLAERQAVSGYALIWVADTLAETPGPTPDQVSYYLAAIAIPMLEEWKS